MFCRLESTRTLLERALQRLFKEGFLDLLSNSLVKRQRIEFVRFSEGIDLSNNPFPLDSYAGYPEIREGDACLPHFSKHKIGAVHN